MIIGKIHVGSGLGDQLFSYISTRTIALDKGYDFGFVGIENFKGKNFMNLDWGKLVDLKYHIEYPAGKLIIDDEHKLFEINKPYYDPEVNFIEDGTVIDGCIAQDERYWNLPDIRKWIKVDPLYSGENTCIINFRGGEYTLFPDLFLTIDYWDKAITLMRKKYPGIQFEVHTDDPETAKKFFNFPIRVGIALNWRAVRYADHLILSNSAFGIMPALLNQDVKEVIAPHYWGRRNIKVWSLPQNYYKKFTYL